MRYHGISCVAGFLGLVLGACSLPSDACVQLPNYGIEVEVRDAQTNVPIAFGATAVARGSQQVYPFEGPFPADSAGTSLRAYVPPGRYDVTVQRPGYRPQTLEGVLVREQEGGCTVQTTRLQANLAREG